MLGLRRVVMIVWLWLLLWWRLLLLLMVVVVVSDCRTKVSRVSSSHHSGPSLADEASRLAVSG